MITNLNDLKTFIHNKINGGTFSLAVDELGSTEIDDLFSNILPNNHSLILTAAQLTEEDRSITVMGQINILNISCRCQAGFFIDSQTPEVTLHLDNLPPDWHFSQSFISLSQQVLGECSWINPELFFDSKATETLPDNFQTMFGFEPEASDIQQTEGANIYKSILVKGGRFTGKLDFSYRRNGNILKSSFFSWFLGGRILDLEGILEFKNTVPLIWIKGLLAADSQVASSFSLPLQYQMISSMFASTNTIDANFYPMTFCRLEADLSFKGNAMQIDIPIAANLYDPSSDFITFDCKSEALSHFAFSELANLLEDSSLEKFFPFGDDLFRDITVRYLQLSFFGRSKKISSFTFDLTLSKEWEVVKDIFSLSDIEGLITITNPFESKQRCYSIELFGKATLFSQEIEGTICIPDMSYSCYLGKGSQVDLTALIEKAFPSIKGLPSLICTDCGFCSTVGSSNYSLEVRFDTPWNLDVVQLENVHFFLSKCGRSISGFVSAEFELNEETDLTVSADYQGEDIGWIFSGSTTSGEVFTLTDLLGRFFKPFKIKIPSQFSDIAFQDIAFVVNSQTKEFSFKGQAATVHKILLGKSKIALSFSCDINSNISPQTQKRELKGKLLSSFTVGKSTFSLEYDLGVQNLFVGKWEMQENKALNVKDLVLCSGLPFDLIIPTGLNVGLTEAVFQWNFTTGVFFLSANSKTLGEAFFLATKETGTWGFILGIATKANWKFSDIPGAVGNAFKFLDFMKFEDAAFVLSSLEADNVVLPEPLPGLGGSGGSTSSSTYVQQTNTTGNVDKNQPSTTGGVNNTTRSFPAVGSGQAVRIVKGVSLAVQIDLKSSGKENAGAKNLHSIAGCDTLLFQTTLAAPIANSQLSVNMPGGVTIKAGDGGFSLGNVYIILIPKPLSLVVQGSTQMNFIGNNLSVTGKVLIGATETQGMLQVENKSNKGDPKSIPFPSDLLGVRLNELGVSFGAYYTPPPAADFGFEGQFSIVGQKAASNAFGYICKILPDVVYPVYLSTYIQELSLRTVVAAKFGVYPSWMPSFFSALQIRDFWLYYAETDTVLPIGNIVPRGFGVNGIIEIQGFTGAHAKLVINSQVGINMGINGDIELPPIKISKIFEMSGNGKGYSVKQKQEKGRWVDIVDSPVLRSQSNADAETRKRQIVPAGGPFFKVRSLSSPFISGDIVINFMEFEKLKAHAEVDFNGIAFSLNIKSGPLDCILDCNLENHSNLSSHTKFDYGADFKLGPIKISGINIGKIHFKAMITVVWDMILNPELFSNKFALSFDFSGMSFTVQCELKINHFTDVIAGIETYIQDNAQTIFKKLFDLGAPYIDLAVKEAKVLKTQANEEVNKITSDAATAAHDVKECADNYVTSIKTGLSNPDKEVKKLNEDTKKIINDAKKKVNEIQKSAKKQIDSVNKTTQATQTQAKKQADKLISDANKKAKDINKKTQDTLTQAKKTANQIIDEANKEAAKSIKDAQSQVTKIGNDAKTQADKVGKSVSNTAHKAKKKIKKHLHA